MEMSIFRINPADALKNLRIFKVSSEDMLTTLAYSGLAQQAS
jgi:hypothetical protein